MTISRHSSPSSRADGTTSTCARCDGPKEWGVFCGACREQVRQASHVHHDTIWEHPEWVRQAIGNWNRDRRKVVA